MTIDRRGLADFLRRARERTGPENVGLPPGARRRTPGLRREEVARLAGRSVDHYIRLEQARGPQPSPQLLGALARALRLTADERDHLHLLAGQRPPVGRPSTDHVTPGPLHLLDQLTTAPARNAMAEALLGGVRTVSEHGRDVVRRWFTDPDARAASPAEEHIDYGRVHVADLRAAMARRPGDATADRLALLQVVGLQPVPSAP